MPGIEFVNRAYELDLICKPGTPRFVLIDGAAGYGKTYLLCRVKEVYEHEREGWKVALIDLKSEPQAVSTDPAVAWPCIANAIIQQFSWPRGRIPTVAVGTGEAGITGTLVPALVRQKANLLLLFDGVEVLPPETSAWLKRLVSGVDQGLQRGRRELRVVFAGRYAGDWGRPAPYALATLPLSPFDQVTVRTMVEQMALRADAPLAPDHVDELAWWVLHISGGHPRGICHVLETVAAEGFIFVDLEFAFLEQQFQIGGQTGTLFDLCIAPIIEELLKDIEPTLRAALAAISPIRRFDQELMDALLNRGIVTAPGYPSSWDVIRALLQTHLISPPTDYPMYSDQIVRRMLCVQMQIQNPETFHQISECAQEIFHDWALDSGVLRADIRRVAILESLYYTLQLEPQQNPPEVIRGRLEQRLDEYLTGMQDLTGVFQLKFALNHDQELNELIERRAGSTAVPALLDVIDRCLA